jgi:hypothetical protein
MPPAPAPVPPATVPGRRAVRRNDQPWPAGPRTWLPRPAPCRPDRPAAPHHRRLGSHPGRRHSHPDWCRSLEVHRPPLCQIMTWSATDTGHGAGHGQTPMDLPPLANLIETALPCRRQSRFLNINYGKYRTYSYHRLWVTRPLAVAYPKAMIARAIPLGANQR